MQPTKYSSYPKHNFYYLFSAALGLHCCRSLPLVAESRDRPSCGLRASLCGGLSRQNTDSRTHRLQQLRRRGLEAVVPKLQHRFNGCGTQPYMLCGMWNLPGPGIAPTSPALADGLFTTKLPGKTPRFLILNIPFLNYLQCYLRKKWQQ